MNYRIPRVQIVPQADDQVAFHVDGQERWRWHASPRYPRPFFFPLLGPSGRSLTRMGHPDASNHDHHRSLWWGHRDVGSVNFWEERGGSQQIRQEFWTHYQDGHEEAAMVVRLAYVDAHKVKLMQQDLIAVYRPLEKGEAWIELQSTFTPTLDALPIGKTNFGFLGLRVAASISAQFGGGRITGSTGAVGEKDNFAQERLWMDYSGPIQGENEEGVTWFDHPTNPNHPTSWHVRDDGWMSAAFNLRDGYMLTKKTPLKLRYGFHVHAGPVDAKIAAERQRRFAASAGWELVAVKGAWRMNLRRG